MLTAIVTIAALTVAAVVIVGVYGALTYTMTTRRDARAYAAAKATYYAAVARSIDAGKPAPRANPYI